MNRVKGALKRFWTRARGLAKRRGGGGEKPKSRGSGVLRRLIPLAGALAASVVVFASLTSCEHGAYSLPLFRTSWCAPWSQAFGFMSTSAGVGFVVFLMMEVITVILAQMWRDRQLDRAEHREEAAERRAEIAELKAEIAERGADAAERRADAAERGADAVERMLGMMEQSRREESERAERREEAAARREEAAARREESIERREEAAAQREARLIELIESLKNGKDGGAK